jgi:hypothetical protein
VDGMTIREAIAMGMMITMTKTRSESSPP